MAIGVNRPAPFHLHPKTVGEAVDTATGLIASGANIDVGLAQINSANLAPLGLSVAQAFDPCRNLEAASRVLVANFHRARPDLTGAQPALRIALSYYNTGRPDRGFRNGYVARVDAAAVGRPSPILAVPALLPARPPAAAWDVFAATSPTARFVITPNPSGDDR